MEKKIKVILAEDDENLGLLLREYLIAKGYDTDLYPDGEVAYKGFQKFQYDLCIFDVMMPKKDGFTLAKEIRMLNTDIPIVFLTAKSMKDDVIEGFKIGADDYMTKPFSMEELLLKIRIFLKRSLNISEPGNDQRFYKVGIYTFYFDSLNLDCNGERKTLTYKEAELLRYFCDNPNKVLSRSDILIQVWGSDDYYLGRSLDVFISRLRKYLSSDENIKILNLHGIGFRFNAVITIN